MNSKKTFFAFLYLAVLVLAFTKTTTAQMYWNQSCQFAGNSSSYIAVPGSTSLNLIGSFTIEVWVNPSSLSGVSKGIVSKGGVLGTSLKYGIRLSNTGRILMITNGAQRLISKSSTSLQTNEWTHVAVTYNAFLSEFKIFLNGTLDTSSVIAGATPATNSDSLYIGISGASTPFTGQLDEVRIWRKVLSDQLVGQYFRSSIGVSTGTYANLILSLTFQNDEASGTLFSLHDWTENLNDGFGRNVTSVDHSHELYSTIGYNESIELDGNDDYLGNIDSLSLSENSPNTFTMQCWVYPRSGDQAYLISTSGSDFSLFINPEGKVEATVEGVTYLSGSAGTLPLNKWTHVAFVMFEQLGFFYYNGKLKNTDTTVIVNLIPDDDKLYIGGGPGSITDFNGFMDEVRIATTSLYQTEIIDQMYMSRDKKFSAGNNYSDYNYNLDGILSDNMKNGGPRLEFKGNAKFSHPSAILNQLVSPLTRSDETNFGKGFYNQHVNKRIPAVGNSGSIVDSFSVNRNTTILDVNLFLALNHSNLSDLSVVLTGPEGDSMVVFSNISSNSLNNNLITIFDDNSENAMTGGTYTSFTPRVKAQINLNPVFAGSRSHGYWKLRIIDNGSSDTGRLYAWGIQINNMQQRECNLNVSALIQGFYNNVSNLMTADTMKLYIWNSIIANGLMDSSKSNIGENGIGLFSIKKSSIAQGFRYYLQLKHRNAIETWSEPTQNYIVFDGYEGIYDFRTDDSKALGNNMALMDILPISYAFYSGDENQDGLVDLNDVVNVFNDGNTFTSGYISSDMNGDNITDLSDVVITLNNANLFVAAVIP